MVHLTEIQCKVMGFILQAMQKTGMPPTLREIAAHFSWKAVGSAQDVISALRKKGVLMPPMPGKSRQLVPTESALDYLKNHTEALPYKNTQNPKQQSAAQAQAMDDNFYVGNLINVPLLGAVQAGNPTLHLDNHQGEAVSFARVPPRTHQANFFAVSVEGFSMMNAGFIPGDILLVESLQHARNGDIVLAAIGSEVTVKRLAQRGSQLYRTATEKLKKQEFSAQNAPPNLLVPENSDFEPIPFGTNDSHRVIGLVRSLYRREIE